MNELTLETQIELSSPDGPNDAKNVIWRHIDLAEQDANGQLESCGLEEAAITAMTQNETRPRIAQFDHGLLIIVRGINMNPGADPEDMISLRIWLDDQQIITASLRRLMAVDTTVKNFSRSKQAFGRADILLDLISNLADRFTEFIDEKEQTLEVIENKIDTKPELSQRSEVAQLRRQCAMVRRFLSPQREALEAMLRLKNLTIPESDLLALRDQSDRFTRYLEDIDLVRDRALLLQEEIMNTVAQQQNERMYALSIVAAIFLPITFITGVFGMNVAGLPGIDVEGAFSMVAGTMVVTTAAVLIWFRTKHWL